MRRVADAQQTGAVPAAQPVQVDVEQLDLVPGAQGVRPVGDPGDGIGEGGQEAVQAGGPALGVGALGDERGALPVVAAVDHRGEEALTGAADEPARVALAAREAEPPGVHRAGEVVQAQFGQGPGQ